MTSLLCVYVCHTQVKKKERKIIKKKNNNAAESPSVLSLLPFVFCSSACWSHCALTIVPSPSFYFSFLFFFFASSLPFCHTHPQSPLTDLRLFFTHTYPYTPSSSPLPPLPRFCKSNTFKLMSALKKNNQYGSLLMPHMDNDFHGSENKKTLSLLFHFQSNSYSPAPL